MENLNHSTLESKKSSPNGGPTMSPEKSSRKRDLKANDICGLIEVCGRSGVASMKWGDLELTFQTELKEQHLTQQAWPVPISPLSADTEISEAKHKNYDDFQRTRLESDEQRLREDQLAEMLLTDPVQYEELLASGELEDEKVHRSGT